MLADFDFALMSPDGSEALDLTKWIVSALCAVVLYT
jgi:hypothetical protein